MLRFHQGAKTGKRLKQPERSRPKKTVGRHNHHERRTLIDEILGVIPMKKRQFRGDVARAINHHMPVPESHKILSRRDVPSEIKAKLRSWNEKTSSAKQGLIRI